MTKIYLDHSATTPTDPQVLEAMLPYFNEIYGNAESHHDQGKRSKVAIDTARETIAKYLNCRPSEIIFTGSGTESNNLAILGTARANPGSHLITTKLEHSSVLNPFKQLEKEGHEVTYLGMDEDLSAAIRPNTALVSIMYANNEIGSILPIEKYGKICANAVRKTKSGQITQGVPFHTDACQAANHLSLDTKGLGLTLMTINGSKIYGPKGVGALYIKRGHKINPIQYGGGHENGLRPGTHATAAIIGLAKALELAQKSREKESARLTTLRDKLIDGLLKIPNSHLNGHLESRLPNNVNIAFEGISATDLLLQLNDLGIYISTGSACDSGKDTPSHVLQAINTPTSLLDSSIRITLGRSTTENNIDHIINAITKIIEQMRS